jgi:sialidase-1
VTHTRNPGRRRSAVATALLTLVALLAPAQAARAGGVTGSAPAAGEIGYQQVLFQSGTAGYGCFRIPDLVRTKANTLLAFAEGRKSQSCGDRGDTDLVVRRSTDDGRTWSPLRVIPAGSTATGSYGVPGAPPGVVDGSPVTRGNPAAVVDAGSGRIHLLSVSDPANSSTPRVPWEQYSSDDGLTWSDPTMLSVTIAGSTPIGDRNWFGTGPGHGIQLTAGPAKGRLVVGVHEQAGGGNYGGYLYLDPDPVTGEGTWKAASAADSTAGAGTAPAEVSVAETGQGNVQLIARSGSQPPVAVTATTPSDPTVRPQIGSFQPTGLSASPDVQGSLLRLHPATSGGPEQMLYASPSSGRNNLRIWSRCGTTWTANGKLIRVGPAAYSDLALLRSGEIGLLNEEGAIGESSADEIRFTRIPESALGNPCGRTDERTPDTTQQQPAPGPTSPDVSPQANDAYLYGGATLGAGQPDGSLDRALSLTTGSYAEVPYAQSLLPGSGSFSFSLWFKYTASTAADPDRMLFDAYGFGADMPQVWLRARPGEDDLFAGVRDSADHLGLVSVEDGSGLAFGDGNWHHAAVVRTTTGQFTLAVDGNYSSEPASGITGDVTAPPTRAPGGIRIGGTLTTPNAEGLPGSVNEFRLYRTALTPAQVAALAVGTAAGDPVPGAEDSLALRLPFQVVDEAVPANRQKIAGVEDESEHCSPAWVVGGAAARRPGLAHSPEGGQALQVDSAHRGVEAPMTPALDLGDGDFTASLWFSYTPTSDNSPQALMWAYGMGTGVPQLWVQARPDPHDDDIIAVVQTDGPGSAKTLSFPDTATTSPGFSNGVWHHVVLERSGGTVTLSVDNKTAPDGTATATGVTGSLTSHRAEGIRGLRIGSRLDGASTLNGAVDEFRLYHEALGTGDLATLQSNTGISPTAHYQVRYSFDDKYVAALAATQLAPAATPATPDSSDACNHAYLMGGADVVAGQHDGHGALLLNGSGAGLLIPPSASLSTRPESVSGAPTRPGESTDFTFTSWFRYDAAASPANQVLLRSFGEGPNERLLTVVAQPGRDQLQVTAQSDTGEIQFSGTDPSGSTAFGDGDWHELALVRSGDSLLLYVDGALAGSSPMPPGALTRSDGWAQDGLRLGSNFDGTGGFTGALDDVRVFRSALTPAEITDLYGGTVPAARGLVLSLSFDIQADQSYPRM